MDLLLGVCSKFSRCRVANVRHPDNEGDVLPCKRMVAVNGYLCIIYPNHPKVQGLALLIFRIEFRTHVAQFFRRVFNIVRESEAGIMRTKGFLRPQQDFGGIACA